MLYFSYAGQRYTPEVVVKNEAVTADKLRTAANAYSFLAGVDQVCIAIEGEFKNEYGVHVDLSDDPGFICDIARKYVRVQTPEGVLYNINLAKADGAVAKLRAPRKGDPVLLDCTKLSKN